MYNFQEIYEQYLHKLEINKSYKLGDIYNRLAKLQENCDMFILYLQLYLSDNFVVKMVDEKWENILVIRIN